MGILLYDLLQMLTYRPLATTCDKPNEQGTCDHVAPEHHNPYRLGTRANAEAIDGRRRNVIVSTEGVEEHGDARYTGA